MIVMLKAVFSMKVGVDVIFMGGYSNNRITREGHGDHDDGFR